MPKFLRQDYHTRKRLKAKWRRPRGRQSKLAFSKGGSGVRPRIGYKGVDKTLIVVSNIQELELHKSKSVLLASQIGAKKAAEMSKKAQELGITILNKKKLKRSKRIARAIEQGKIVKAEKKKAAKVAEEKAKEQKEKAKTETKSEPKKEEKKVDKK